MSRKRYFWASPCTAPYKLGRKCLFIILKYQGGLDKQKNVERVVVLNATLGRYRENTGFLITLRKKFLVNEGCNIEQNFIRRVFGQMCGLSNSVYDL